MWRFIFSGLLLATGCLWALMRYWRWRDQQYKSPYYSAALAHHTPKGFKNIPAHQRPSRADLSKWMRGNWSGKNVRHKSTTPLAVKTLTAQNHRALQAPPVGLQATWVGHSTVLVQQEGLNFLTDPIFSSRASPVPFLGPKRIQPPALNIQELPPIHAVLVSHDHYDHLDKASVRALYQLPSKPQFIVPLGMEKWFVRHITHGDHRRIHALDWWQSYALQSPEASLEITLVPALHWSKRSVVGQNKNLWGGFVVKSPHAKTFYTGDTGYSPVYFKQIGERLGPIDLALLPVGAYEPRAIMQYSHTNEAEAVQIFKDVQARHAIGIHWGTFQLTNEAPDAPRWGLPAALKEAGVDPSCFKLLEHGQTSSYPLAVDTPSQRASC